MDDLSGKVGLVTGASRGIGRTGAIALYGQARYHYPSNFNKASTISCTRRASRKLGIV